jgi:hypothetical protein
MSLASNTGIFQYNFYKNTYDFDDEVVAILQKTPFIRRRELINYLMNKNHGKRGYSKTNVNQKIDKMAKRGVIALIQHEDLQKYGIREEDGRASYVTLKQSTDIRDYVDEIFQLLDEGSTSDKLLILREIFSYEKNYVFTPLQLDILVKNLVEDDHELRFYLVGLIHRLIYLFGNKPKNETLFLKLLRDMLKNYPTSPENKFNYRFFLIELLGMYNDRAVVDQLIKDAETLENLSSIEGDYSQAWTAQVIENHRKELFELERRLNKINKLNNLSTIRNIRQKAREHLGMINYGNGGGA